MPLQKITNQSFAAVKRGAKEMKDRDGEKRAGLKEMSRKQMSQQGDERGTRKRCSSFLEIKY